MDIRTFCIVLAAALSIASHATDAKPAVRSPVIVLGIDGLGSMYFHPETDMARVHREIILEGAHTMDCRSVVPADSKPNWAAHTMGGSVPETGVRDNTWTLGSYAMIDATKGHGDGLLPLTDPGQYFPSIFSEVKRHSPHRKTMLVSDWGGFFEIIDPKMVDVALDCDEAECLVDKFVGHVLSPSGGVPDLAVVHFDHVDHAGHLHGWGSQEYMDAVRSADALAGKLFDAYRSAGVWDDTLFILVSDHGGSGNFHGQMRLDNVLVPWFVRGPGVVKNHTLGSYVRNVDTAPTVLEHLGVPIPRVWTGVSVAELRNATHGEAARGLMRLYGWVNMHLDPANAYISMPRIFRLAGGIGVVVFAAVVYGLYARRRSERRFRASRGGVKKVDEADDETYSPIPIAHNTRTRRPMAAST